MFLECRHEIAKSLLAANDTRPKNATIYEFEKVVKGRRRFPLGVIDAMTRLRDQLYALRQVL